jgi:hypothetical protein
VLSVSPTPISSSWSRRARESDSVSYARAIFLKRSCAASVRQAQDEAAMRTKQHKFARIGMRDGGRASERAWAQNPVKRSLTMGESKADRQRAYGACRRVTNEETAQSRDSRNGVGTAKRVRLRAAVACTGLCTRFGVEGLGLHRPLRQICLSLCTCLGGT